MSGSKRKESKEGKQVAKKEKGVSRTGVQGLASDLRHEFEDYFNAQPTPVQGALLGHPDLIQAARDLLKFDGEKSFKEAYDVVRDFVSLLEHFKFMKRQNPDARVVARAPFSLDTMSADLTGKFCLQLLKKDCHGKAEIIAEVPGVNLRLCMQMAEVGKLKDKFDAAHKKWETHVKNASPPHVKRDWAQGKKGMVEQQKTRQTENYERLCALDARFVRPANEDWDFVFLDFADGYWDDMDRLVTAVVLKQNNQVLLTVPYF